MQRVNREVKCRRIAAIYEDGNIDVHVRTSDVTLIAWFLAQKTNDDTAANAEKLRKLHDIAFKLRNLFYECEPEPVGFKDESEARDAIRKIPNHSQTCHAKT